MTGAGVVAAGVDEAVPLLAAGRAVVVVDGADRLAALLLARPPGAPGRVAVLVADPADPVALEAARQLAAELFAAS